jgi:2-dehydro-3-deoxygluconokinase
MNNIIVMGECMVEFGSTGKDGLYRKSFAGDVFNTGIYIKRSVKEQANVKFLTAIGSDKNSNEMLIMMKQESLDTSLVHRSKSAQMGLYLIDVDCKGERSFSYWRETSAAKQMVQFLNHSSTIENIEQTKLFFFSGISIAILTEIDRQILWRFIDRLKASGTKIVFDPNYRPTLWSSIKETNNAYEAAFELADIALPGVDDLSALNNVKSAEDVADLLEKYCVDEIIIKNGSQGILLSLNGERSYIDVEPVENVVDTTSAGDAFNGAYLSARLLGQSAERSARFAAKVSACVIQYRGAIIDKDVFSQHIKNNPM